MAFHTDEPVLIRQLYQQMLKILWKGLEQDGRDDLTAPIPGNLQIALN